MITCFHHQCPRCGKFIDDSVAAGVLEARPFILKDYSKEVVYRYVCLCCLLEEVSIEVTKQIREENLQRARTLPGLI